MALFKNLTFDIGILNRFKKKSKALPIRPVLRKPPIPPKEIRELPTVSKKLVQKSEPKETAELPKLNKPIVPPKINGEVNGKLNSESFFNSLYQHISKEETYLHSNIPKDLMNKNLFDEMQTYWKDKKDIMQNASISKAIKDDLTMKIQELQQLELEWQRLQLQFDKTRDELGSKEILIDNHIRHLKKAFKKAHLHTNIKPEHHFVLAEGGKIRNLQNMIDTLRLMKSDEFDMHVTTDKNDFANWVNDILGLDDLAKNLRTAETKEQMVRLLETWYAS